MITIGKRFYPRPGCCCCWSSGLAVYAHNNRAWRTGALAATDTWCVPRTLHAHTVRVFRTRTHSGGCPSPTTTQYYYYYCYYYMCVCVCVRRSYGARWYRSTDTYRARIRRWGTRGSHTHEHETLRARRVSRTNGFRSMHGTVHLSCSW